jgi:hypothetical protein
MVYTLGEGDEAERKRVINSIVMRRKRKFKEQEWKNHPILELPCCSLQTGSEPGRKKSSDDPRTYLHSIDREVNAKGTQVPRRVLLSSRLALLIRANDLGLLSKTGGKRRLERYMQNITYDKKIVKCDRLQTTRPTSDS